ncbi:MAG TPA: phosphatase PAP2 family protein [Gemmatimonadaceae bacterium]|nr:phosphatase PAP2 family protein [Gemmatimonadaceae bacterium]
MQQSCSTTRRAIVGLLAAAALAAAAPAAGQSVIQQIGEDFGNAGKDMWFIWTSPLHGSAHDWGTFALATAAVAGTGAFDERIDAYIRRHPSSTFVTGIEKFRDRGEFALADFGSARYLQPVAGGLYVLGLAFGSRTLRDAGMGCAAAYEAGNVVRTLVYTGVARTRPVASPDDPYRFDVPGGEWETHSFFGGHAANIMSCVAFWNARFHMGPAEPVLVLLATGIALGRMADHVHWASDTMVGMLFGYAVGRNVGIRSLRRAQDEDGEKAGAPAPTGVAAPSGPLIAPGEHGLLLRWRMTF